MPHTFNFPGAIGVSQLKVYDTPGPDGLVGGSPHVHLLCKEAYLVTAGRGAVQTLSRKGFREVPLEPGRLVWFTPGLIHRLINLDGRLEITVLMANTGMPEAGDFALVFPDEVLADAAAYRHAASLAAPEHVHASSPEAARRRRDLAVEGFVALRQAFEIDGQEALETFYNRAVRLVQPNLARWRSILESGPVAEVASTRAQLGDLERGHIGHLVDADVRLSKPLEPRKLGMCGTLELHLPEGSIPKI